MAKPIQFPVKASAWVLFTLSCLCPAAAQTYVNQRVTNNSDGSRSTNWVECVIEGEVTWPANQGPYIVDNYDLGITVKTNGSLTLEPGAVLEFAASRDWSGLQVFGSLRASGGVTFRRWSRDANGTWSGIRFYTNSVGVLDQVVIEDAGHVASGWQAGHPAAAVYIEDSSPTLRNVIVRRSGQHGLRLVQSAAPIVEDSHFEQCAGHAVLWTHLQGTPIFRGNAGVSNNFNAIYVGNGTLGQDWTMEPNQMPYVLQGWDGNLAIATNATLTIQPGTVVKCTYGRDGGAIDVYGNLQCGGGTAPVILTSLEDDSILGDTDNSTNATFRGAWSGIRFQPGSQGLIENTELRYSGHVTTGWQAGHPGAAINIDSASPTIRRVLITGAEGYGFKLLGSTQAHVENNQIDDSGNYAVLWTSFSGSPVLLNNHGTNNAHDGVLLPNGTLTADTTFHLNPGLPYVTVGWDGVLVVNTNVSLTVMPGVVVKNAYGRDGGAIVVYGELFSQGTAGQPVIFTSMEDDIQGDTDRTTNAVYAGAWSGVRIYAPGQATFTHTQIRYSGHVTSGWQGWHPSAAVYVAGGTAALDQVVIDHAQDLAVRFNANDVTMTGCTLLGGPRGIWVEGGGTNALVNFSRFLGITDFAVINSNTGIEFDARSNWWGHVTGPGGAGPGSGAQVSQHVRFEPYSGGVAARVYLGMASTLQPPTGVSAPFRIISGELPAGLQFDPGTGTVTGKATVNGSVQIEVQSTAPGGSSLPFYYLIDARTLLQSPPDGSQDWTTHPVLSWEGTAGASYRVQLAADPGFTQIVLDTPGLRSASKEIAALKPGTEYYWRISSSALGEAWSAAASFRTWSTGPLSGYAVQFDGVDDQINLDATPNLSQMPQWSITAWVNPAAVQIAPWPTIFSYGYWGADLGLNTQTGALESWLNNTAQLIGSKPVPTNQWSFVALVHDGTDRILYLNGEEVGRAASGAVGWASSAAIGAEPGGKSTSHFTGAIDELAIWQKALDSQTLLACMAHRVSERDFGFVQGYYLDEGAGPVANECAYRGVTASLISNPVWIKSGAGSAWENQPQLSVGFTNGQELILSWGINGEGFILESCTSLSPNVSWQPVTSTPSASDSGFRITIDSSGLEHFYRLRRP